MNNYIDFLNENQRKAKQTLDNLLKYFDDKEEFSKDETAIRQHAVGIMDFYNREKKFEPNQITWLKNISKKILESTEDNFDKMEDLKNKIKKKFNLDTLYWNSGVKIEYRNSKGEVQVSEKDVPKLKDYVKSLGYDIEAVGTNFHGNGSGLGIKIYIRLK